MSIAFGIVTTNNAFVGSDGKETGGRLDFNKTFRIINGDKKFIGAFTGYLYLEGMIISDVLQQALNTNLSDDINTVIYLLKNSVRDKIQNSINNNNGFHFETYIILIGSRTWNENNILMHHIWLKVENGVINGGCEQCANPRAIGSAEPAAFVNNALEYCLTNQPYDLNDFLTGVIKSACSYDLIYCGRQSFVMPMI